MQEKEVRKIAKAFACSAPRAIRTIRCGFLCLPSGHLQLLLSQTQGEADSDAIAEVVSPVDSDTVEVVDEPVDSDEGDNEPTEVVERPVVPAEKRDGPIVEERPPPRRVVELICPESLRVNCHDDQGERLVSAACDASESSRLNVPGGVEVTCIVQSDGWRNACVLAPAKVPTRLRVDPESTGCEWE